MTQARYTAAWQASSSAAAPTLEFFATCMAALAQGETDPKLILESVIDAMGVDKSALLGEQAARYGYGDAIESFEASLLEAIDEQLFGLRACHLTAADRAQRRLIASL